jgi:uncharacterized membrane protein
LLSLAGNAFFGSWLLTRPAHMSGFEQLRGNPDAPRLKQLMQRIQKLPEEQRQQVREKLREFVPQLKELAKAGREQRQLIEQLMLAPQLQAEQLQAAFAEQRTLQEKAQDLRQQMLIDIASTLTPEQRMQLFKGKSR